MHTGNSARCVAGFTDRRDAPWDARLAINAEEDRLVQALLIWMLRERQHGRWRS